MLEREIEKKLVDGVRKLGGRAYKFVSPGNDGVPDRIVILPQRVPKFIELKTEYGKIIQPAESADQETQKFRSGRPGAVWVERCGKISGGDATWNLNLMPIKHTASRRS